MSDKPRFRVTRQNPDYGPYWMVTEKHNMVARHEDEQTAREFAAAREMAEFVKECASGGSYFLDTEFDDQAAALLARLECKGTDNG